MDLWWKAGFRNLYRIHIFRSFKNWFRQLFRNVWIIVVCGIFPLSLRFLFSWFCAHCISFTPIKPDNGNSSQTMGPTNLCQFRLKFEPKWTKRIKVVSQLWMAIKLPRGYQSCLLYDEYIRNHYQCFQVSLFVIVFHRSLSMHRWKSSNVHFSCTSKTKPLFMSLYWGKTNRRNLTVQQLTIFFSILCCVRAWPFFFFVVFGPLLLSFVLLVFRTFPSKNDGDSSRLVSSRLFSSCFLLCNGFRRINCNTKPKDGHFDIQDTPKIKKATEIIFFFFNSLVWCWKWRIRMFSLHIKRTNVYNVHLVECRYTFAFYVKWYGHYDEWFKN